MANFRTFQKAQNGRRRYHGNERENFETSGNFGGFGSKTACIVKMS